ncbi:maleylpyruvate isomerase N-terminal domain-containing protein [Chryseobacterium terrae]|uniref:Maleylpyruvate isomerase N-terminal domain-containing protein n=1 Tax=Chryseobacterium terrae TaxID=3163299 RepID=A0ABW8Y0J3_9FLAO
MNKKMLISHCKTTGNKMKEEIEIKTLELFPVLDRMLIDLLKSLTDEEWDKQTVAKLWKVKDVASHLLDGNLRGLSISRDKYFGEQADNINSYEDLVSFLNNLNMSWTNATKRLSPQILTELLAITGKEYIEHLTQLKPFDNSVFSVAWAGQETSQNRFHIAREYTEKFLHQQQIREAVNKQGIMTKELYYPFLDTFMYALPHTFRNIEVEENTTVSLIVSTDIGGQWNTTKKKNDWVLSKGAIQNPNSIVTIDPNTAWKLFSKSWTPEQVVNKVELVGDKALGEQILQMVSVMA